METRRAEVLGWVEGRLGRSLTLAEQADLLAAGGLDGDAAHRFTADFAARFGVALTGYRAELHHADERRARGMAWPIPLPPPMGVRVPLSVTLLTRAAEEGAWRCDYPRGLAPVPSPAALNLGILGLGLPALTAALVALVPALF
jgi:hypothetical protein